eukprot:COSAG06_NODE_48291_length_333_cov_0.675214_1_plen_54_part_01
MLKRYICVYICICNVQCTLQYSMKDEEPRAETDDRKTVRFAVVCMCVCVHSCCV